MPHVNLLVKPASSLCNMRCRYCFYEDEASKRTQANMGMMQPETVELLVYQVLQAAGPQGSVSIAFQGGEPTLAGLAFFEAFVKTVKKQNSKNLPISYAIQTNGLCMDENWAYFLAKNHFLVGISLDGDKALHDEFRVDVAGKGTWQRVQKNIQLLRRSGVECNLLCVVTKRCAKSAVRIYHALQKTGITYFQFIPCLDPIDEPRGQQPWSLTPQDYGTFLCALFDEWYRDWQNGEYKGIRLFEDYVHLAMGLPSSTCATNGRCGAYFVVEADGSVYPCDFYGLDQWKLGNIHQTSLLELSQSTLAAQFLQQGLNRPVMCKTCKWARLCRGGCKRDWYTCGKNEIKNYYCASFKRFFDHCEHRLNIISQQELALRTKAQGFCKMV